MPGQPYAFRDCSSLNELTLPEGLTTLESYAFSGCSGLRSVSVPGSLGTLNNSVFSDCSGLQELTLGEGLSAIGANAFKGCTSLTSLSFPASLTSLAGQSFYNCTGLSQLNYPTGWSKTLPYSGYSYAQEYAEQHDIPVSHAPILQGSRALSGTVLDAEGAGVSGVLVTAYDLTDSCTLETVQTGSDGSWSIGVPKEHRIQISYYSTEYALSTSVVRIEAGTEAEVLSTVTASPLSGFVVADESELTWKVLNGSNCQITGYSGTADKVILPMTIGQYTVQSIGSRAFEDNTGLKGVILPPSVTEIGSYAFSGCTSLSELTLAEGLLSIGAYAFEDCTSLISVSLPSSLTSLAGRAFYNCTGLSQVEYPTSWSKTLPYGNYSYTSPFQGCTALTSVTIPEGVTQIPDYAFQNCSSLVTVSLPDSLTTIGEYTFDGCSGLAELTLPTGLKSIDSYAFRGCSGLTELTLPEGLATLESYAFTNCTGLKSVAVPGSLGTLSSSVFSDCSGLQELTLGEGLSTIEANAFKWCTSLTSLSFPTSLTSLAGQAFYNCTGLSQLNYPTGWSKTLPYSGYSYTSPFQGCTSLTSVTIPEGVTQIPDYAFQNCSSLVSVSLPDTLTKMGTYAFNGCAQLSEIQWSAALTQIPDYAFQNCTDLDTLELPENLQSIGRNAFSGCSGLRQITFNDTLEVIGNNAFQNCTGLVTLVCNDGLKTISDYAFSGCGNLTTVNIPKSVSACGSNSFQNCPKVTLYCYSGTAAHYAAEAAGWNYLLLDQHEHSFEETVETAATCTRGGSARYTCTLCGYQYVEVLEPLGHSYEEETVPPTCTQQGYTLHTCTRCGDTYRDQYTEPSGHSYGPWIVDREATYWEEGSMHRECSIDGAVETQVIPKLEASEDMGTVRFTVVNAQSLEPLSGAQILATLEDGTEVSAVTDESGKAQLLLPQGQQAICVTAAGCQPRSFRITVTSGLNELPAVGMSSQPVYDATVTSHRMSYDEILEAGIDVDAVGNQHVYKYELKLVFEPEIDWLSLTYYMGEFGYLFGGFGTGSGSGGGSGGSSGGGGGGGSGSSSVVWIDDGEGKGHFFLPSGSSNDGESLTIYPVSEYFYLIIRGEVRWLKEMFDVEMLVVNNSMTDTLENLSATLELPEGLSLAAMVGSPQTLTQSLPDLAGGESHSVHWYVRGDTAGSYSVNARLQGKIMPFEEEIDQTFICQNQLQVWAGNALHLHFEFPSSTYYNDDYPITITLENVSNITLYNLSHKVQIEQGMIYYYADGTTKEKIDTSQWYSSRTIREFRPGDKLIMEMTVNIFFESELAEQQLEKLIGMVDGAEQMLNAFKAVKAGINAAQTLQKTVTGAIKALDGFDFNLQNEDAKKLELFSQLHKKLSTLYTSYSSTGDKTLDALLKMGNSGVTASLDAMSQDPGKWLKETAYEDLSKLVKQVDALGNQLASGGGESRKFDIFDSIRTLISAIPIRFVLAGVFMTEDEDNTTSIPWSYSTTPGHVQYFGVTDLSRTLMAYIQYGFGSMYEDTVPGILQLVPGLDDPFHKDEAIQYLQTVEDQITQLKATSASGNTSFRVWLERADSSLGLLSAEDTAADFILSCDNDTAVMENGVLTFTGDGLISVTPTSQAGGILHIEDSEGNTYTYQLGVVAPHTCTPGEREVVVQPTEAYDGFAVRCCPVCGDIMEVELLTVEDLCSDHQFGPWETETEATHTAGGLQHRLCAVCGAVEYRATEKLSYTQEELPVTISSDTAGTQTAVLTNRSGETADVHMILAVYSSDGQMLASRAVAKELKPDETLDLTLQYAADASTAKTVVYLLDPLTLAPLCQKWQVSES